MKGCYNICGLKVLADLRHDTMLSRSEKYLSDHQPDESEITISYDRPAIGRLLAQGISSEAAAENMLTANVFYTELLKRGGFMLHSSAVVVDGRAYLFSAPSGTGKSTHTSLWLKVFGERAYILNDDKPALRFSESGEIIAYGTPWSGKSELNVNTGVPVQGICVLERAEENFIVPMSDGDAAFSILDQTIRPTEESSMLLLLEYIDRLVRTVSVWRMGCNISPEAAHIAYDTMSKT